MTRCAGQILFSLWLANSLAAGSVSCWDETQLQVLQHYSTPLRWDNVERGPQWVAGPKPEYDLKRRLHLIRLQPGEHVTLHGDAGAWLRLVPMQGAAGAEHYRATLSSDGRLFAESPLWVLNQGESLLLPNPLQCPSLARITHTGKARTELLFAAYFSRQELSGTIAPFRSRVRLPGQTVRLRHEGETTAERVRLIKPQESLEFPVSGPARYQLSTWLPWPTTEFPGGNACSIQLRLDHTNLPELRLSPEVDGRQPVRLNGVRTLLSREMNGYFDVPPGKHTFALRPTQAMYLSLFSQASPDFLLPSLNAPAGYPLCDNLAANPATIPAEVESFARNEQLAAGLALDNSARDSAAQAAQWLKGLAQSRPDYPPARLSAEQVWRRGTAFREVLPASPGAVVLLRYGFSPPRLRRNYQSERPVAVFNPTSQQVARSFAEGYFATPSGAASEGVFYLLPERSYDSQLRIAALASAPGRAQFRVQFDNQPAFECVVEDPEPFALSLREPAREFATLQLLGQNARLPDGCSLCLPFGAWDLPAPLAQPGVAEVPLPQQVRQVRISQSTTGAPLSFAVAYRASKPFEMGEENYLQLLLNSNRAPRLRLLCQEGEPPTSFQDREFLNQCYPLKRLIRAHAASVTNGIEIAAGFRANGITLAPEERTSLKKTAETLEQAGSTTEALGVWARLFWEGPPDGRTEAALALVRLLDAAGEDFLAMQYARYLLAFSQENALPPPAVSLLEAYAKRDDDTLAHEQLKAFLFTRCPCEEHLAGLVEAFALNSRDELVLRAGSILSPARRPAEGMLAAALRLNWWQTFDQLRNELEDHQAKCFWQAQKLLAFYDFAGAERELRAAGVRGRTALEALRAGLRIRGQLSAASAADRLEAIIAWEQWQAKQLGTGTRWEPASAARYECSGSELLYDVEQDAFTSWLKTGPASPVKLRFLGPVRLRLESRLLLTSPSEKPVDDWLEVSEFGLTKRIAICQAMPNPALKSASDLDAAVSYSTCANLDWGPGFHEVELRIRGGAGFVRALQSEPELPLRVLPGLSLDRVSHVMQQGYSVSGWPKPRVAERTPGPGVWWVSPELAKLSSAESVRRTSAADSQADVPFSPIQLLRLALRLEDTTTWPSVNSGVFRNLSVEEQWLAARRWNRLDLFHDWDALHYADRESHWIGVGKVTNVLTDRIFEPSVPRLTALLQTAEQFPAWRPEAQCIAEWITLSNHIAPAARKVLNRLTQDRVWIPLPLSPSSAGLRPFYIAADASQDPALRIRHALTPMPDTNEFTLGAQNVFAASMVLQRDAQIRLKASLVRAGLTPLAPVTALVQLDNQPAQQLGLSGDKRTEETRLTLGPGAHLVRAWIKEPVANQFVRLSFSGEDQEVTDRSWTDLLAEARQERCFLVGATDAQPVTFPFTGPALLRLDEHRDGRLMSSWRFVEAGEQRVVIPPAAGAAESWYRLYVRSTRTNKTEVLSANPSREPVPVPGPKLRVPALPTPASVQPTDYYSLAGQEDGTWSASALLAHRRPFEWNGQRELDPNEFLEFSGSHQKITGSETLWFGTEVLARVHEPGDLTFGIAEEIQGRPESVPLEWVWTGEVFAGTAGPQGRAEAALHTGFDIGQSRRISRKLQYYPHAGLFARYLTMTDERAMDYGYIDQDLFTAYRAEHRWGWELGNRLRYQPWMDTVMSGDFDLVSNEDLAPDNLGVAVCWRQLFGSIHTELTYRVRYYMTGAARSENSWLQGVSVGIYGEHWLGGRHRLEFGGQYRHDWPDAGDSYFLVLRWAFSQGRGYKDENPRQTAFRQLRSHRIPGGFNNTLEMGPPGASLP